MLRLLLDREPLVQGTAIRALGKIGDRRATEPLILLISEERNPGRRPAIEAIGTLGDPQGEPALIKVLLNPREKSSLRASAAKALGSVGGINAVDPLLEGLKASNHSVREASATTLGDLGDPRAIAKLVFLLCDEDVAVCAAAVGALESMAGESQKAEAVYDAAIARLKKPTQKYFKDMRCRKNVYHLLATIAPQVSIANKSKWPGRRRSYVNVNRY